MADDMDDIEDLLEAPYKAEKTSLLTKIDAKTEVNTTYFFNLLIDPYV